MHNAGWKRMKLMHEGQETREDEEGHRTAGCVDKNGVLHKFNTKWRTKDCYSCTCTKKEIQCCSVVFTPVDYDKEKCERIFYEDTCSYTVVEKADPSKHCEVRGIVG
ncbi:beta-microseminoprotein J1-like isoform X3 [Emydura macquarii macquarii]|uniref:beta-microseminoprotein J1-like isoform X3 n=1 Tax=Emydura macquarii macquarii TaxID=1129001 RepID=UPI00352BA86B